MVSAKSKDMDKLFGHAHIQWMLLQLPQSRGAGYEKLTIRVERTVAFGNYTIFKRSGPTLNRLAPDGANLHILEVGKYALIRLGTRCTFARINRI